MTLSLAQHRLDICDECEHLRFIRNNFLPLLPRLVSQSQFNRRARSLCWLINQMLQHLVGQMGVAHSPCQLIDGTPRPGAPLAVLWLGASALARGGAWLLRRQEAYVL